MESVDGTTGTHDPIVQQKHYFYPGGATGMHYNQMKTICLLTVIFENILQARASFTLEHNGHSLVRQPENLSNIRKTCPDSQKTCPDK